VQIFLIQSLILAMNQFFNIFELKRKQFVRLSNNEIRQWRKKYRNHCSAVDREPVFFLKKKVSIFLLMAVACSI